MNKKSLALLRHLNAIKKDKIVLKSNELQFKINELKSNLATLEEQQIKPMPFTLSGIALKNRQTWLCVISEHVVNAKNAIIEFTKELNLINEELKDLSLEDKRYERLENKVIKAEQAIANIREQKFFDELASRSKHLLA